MIREPNELDLLTEEQAIDGEPQPPVSKPRGRPRKNHGTAPMMARQYRRREPEAVKPLPAWMSDPSLLPKRPPGR